MKEEAIYKCIASSGQDSEIDFHEIENMIQSDVYVSTDVQMLQVKTVSRRGMLRTCDKSYERDKEMMNVRVKIQRP